MMLFGFLKLNENGQEKDEITGKEYVVVVVEVLGVVYDVVYRLCVETFLCLQYISVFSSQ